MSQGEVEYVGFWPRVGASLIDTIIIFAVVGPLLVWIYGWESLIDPDSPFIKGPVDFLLSWIGPAVFAIWFWMRPGATPGKMVIGARVVDATTGHPVSFGQALGRYLGYFVSAIVMMLGYVWVAFDPRKQGWHDKMARTVVIRSKNRVEPVEFARASKERLPLP